MLDKFISKNNIKKYKRFYCSIGTGFVELDKLIIEASNPAQAEREFRRLKDLHPLTPVMVREVREGNSYVYSND